MDDRDDVMRRIAEDLGLDWQLVKRAGDAVRAEREAETVRALCRIDEVAAQVAADATHDWLRPALSAAGFAPQDVERFEVTWVREDGFRPGLFAQEGVEYGRCAVGYDCPPWPEADGS